eukprot:Clim_evm1s226 gene=Clim_evmTU1s226
MKFVEKTLFLFASLGSMLDAVQGMPTEDSRQIGADKAAILTVESLVHKTNAVSMEGTLDDGITTEIVHTPDGDTLLVSTTVERIPDPGQSVAQEELGYGCAKIWQTATRTDGWGVVFTVEQHTEACMTGTVTDAKFTKVAFTYSRSSYDTTVLEDGYYEYDWALGGKSNFTVGADFDEYGNVIMRSVFGWLTGDSTLYKYLPVQTTFYGYGAWRTDLLDPVNSRPNYGSVANWFEDNYPPPPNRATVKVVADGPGKLRLYQNGSYLNKPSPWVMDPGVTILITSDPSDTSKTGYVALAQPESTGNFVSWADGTKGSYTVVVAMDEDDPWQTETSAHAIFEISEDISVFELDYTQSRFWGTTVRDMWPEPALGYRDENGYIRFGRIMLTSQHWAQFDIFKMTITPTGEVTDLDLYLQNDWPMENIYDPTGQYDDATGLLTLSMGTDFGPIQIVMQTE